MGWTVPWYSSDAGDFGADFGVVSERDGAAEGGELPARPGVSCFLSDGDRVFHTYSAHGRGLEGLGSTTSLLDLTALGRQEPWEEPRGRAHALGAPATPEHPRSTTSTTTDTDGDGLLRKAESALTLGSERVSTTSQYRHRTRRSPHGWRLTLRVQRYMEVAG
ncbi:hypothetical protein SALBM217S_05128 [Streptomyces griseoloalbus]